MPGTERLFVDAQWLKSLDEDYRWTLFSRSRATAEYDNNQTDLFTGAYLNYTTTSGLGTTLVGRISSREAGLDIGIHYFKANKNFLIYALPSVSLKSSLNYSWFSIIRYTPVLGEKTRLYSSLELFAAFRQSQYLASVQRLRLGLDLQGYQFGLALNLSGLGDDFPGSDINPGLFIRKQFN